MTSTYQSPLVGLLRASITIRLTSCFTCLDWSKQVNLLLT